MIASLTKRQQIEKERERFINSYIDRRLSELSAEHIAAYEQPDDLKENMEKQWTRLNPHKCGFFLYASFSSYGSPYHKQHDKAKGQKM